MIPYLLSNVTLEELKSPDFQAWIHANAAEFIGRDKAFCHYSSDEKAILVQVMFKQEYQESGFSVPASPTLFLMMMHKVTGIVPQQLLSLMSVCMMDAPKAAEMRREYGISRIAVSIEDAAYQLLFRWYLLQKDTADTLDETKDYS